MLLPGAHRQQGAQPGLRLPTHQAVTHYHVDKLRPRKGKQLAQDCTASQWRKLDSDQALPTPKPVMSPARWHRPTSTATPPGHRQAQPGPGHLTRSSFFCIQLYFLLGFSSRGSRRFLSGSTKGLSSTSFSMWLLAASRLSSEGRTARPRSAPAHRRQVSPCLRARPTMQPGGRTHGHCPQPHSDPA